MNNILVFCQNNDGVIADVSLELLTKARELAKSLNCEVEAFLAGWNVEGLADELFSWGATRVFLAQSPRLEYYRTLPYSAILERVIEKYQPQIVLFGATSVGRDLAPRVSSYLKSGLTADCTQLEIGGYTNPAGKEYSNLLYQIRPAFGGNIIATIVNPDHRPQMATVREGVMRKEKLAEALKGEVITIAVEDILDDSHEAVKIIDRQIEKRDIDIKGAQIIVAGGYGLGSKDNFELVRSLAKVLGGEVGASRAAVDAGFAEPARQIGQTGVTVRPKLFISVGISGQIQHTAGMDGSAMIIAINSDPKAPIHRIADYSIVGDLNIVVPKLIEYYKKHSK